MPALIGRLPKLNFSAWVKSQLSAIIVGNWKSQIRCCNTMFMNKSTIQYVQKISYGEGELKQISRGDQVP